MTNKISTLFLDIGGVLLCNGWDHVSRHLAAAKFDIDIPDMESRHRSVFEVFEEGKITLEEYLEETVFFKHREFTIEAFTDFMFSRSASLGGMIELFSRLKAKYELKIVVVSNESRDLNEYRIAKFRLFDLVDFFISSCYVHVRKPDPAIFRMALDCTHVNPCGVLYIEDLQEFIDIASGFGIKGIRHSGYQSTLNALADAGLVL